MIAQEIEKIVPEVVTTGSDGVKRVKYTDLIPLVIEAMQEQNMALKRLTADTTQLKTENERLKAESATLKARADKADARADKADARVDKAEADIRAKDAAIAQLKAALCSKFSDFPFCASTLAE